MAIRNVLDSDVDRMTSLAIQGVTAFIALYEEERVGEEPRVASGPVSAPSKRRPTAMGEVGAKSSPRRRHRR